MRRERDTSLRCLEPSSRDLLRVLRDGTGEGVQTALLAEGGIAHHDAAVDLSLVFRLVREWYVRDGLEDDLVVGVDRGWEGLGRAVDRDGRGAQGA